MAYLIFHPNRVDTEGALFKIAANDTDRDNLLLNLSDWKVISCSDADFNAIVLGSKIAKSYNSSDVVTFEDHPDHDQYSVTEDEMAADIKDKIDYIEHFLKSNPTHADYTKWNNYKSQLSSLDLSAITFPYGKTLEKHFSDAGSTVLHILQLP